MFAVIQGFAFKRLIFPQRGFHPVVGQLWIHALYTSHVIAPNVEAFRAELARLYQYHPQAPAFISIDPEAGVVTHHFERKPEV